MKRFLKNPIFILTLCTSLFIASCGDDNDDLVVTEPDSEFDGEIIVTEANSGDKRSAVINADIIDDDEVLIKVRFATTTENMRRLYITQNIGGTGIEVYNINENSEGIEIDDKADGSVDLMGDNKKEFEFQIRLAKPIIDDGTVVYTLWTTTGRGDFRDISKRNAIGDTAVGTVTLEYGSSVNATNGIKSFSETITLKAPLGDGSSETFISLFNEEIYRIDQGEEVAALWDFGYYYGVNNRASLASTISYPNEIINIPEISGVADAELNSFYFAKTDLTQSDFDAITIAADLDGIVQSDNQVVTNLEPGSVVEFVDSYGNKGVILVVSIVEGAGTNGEITLDIKVQI